MAKRESVMLAHPYDELKHCVYGWFVSDKLDGQRALWDGGITRGFPIASVPFANIDKDSRLLNQDYVASGLWTRNMKAIRAPGWWLDRLPKIPLDGELYAGVGNFQLTSSIVRGLDGEVRDWHKVRFLVFDSPSIQSVFYDSEINSPFYKKKLAGVIEWCNQRRPEGFHELTGSFEQVFAKLRQANITNVSVDLCIQTRLPYGPESKAVLNELLYSCVDAGGEGLMLRKPESLWTPERSHNLLKVKRTLDAEAEVVGYAWGRKTDKGSRLLGMMGALIVRWEGNVFELSGFTDSERRLVLSNGNDAYDIGRQFPGQIVQLDSGISNPSFPVGSKVTFQYRELTDSGVPKEGRYLRRLIS